MKPKFLQVFNFNLGADPEVFLQDKNGTIIGSELVIGKHTDNKLVVMDGVQAELHPTPSTCRQSFSIYIQQCFNTLKAELSKKKYDMSTDAVIMMDKNELKRLSDEAKRLGCAPSLNTYDANATIKVDPEKYLVRSAGGHIHLGFNDTLKEWKSYDQNYQSGFSPEVMVPLLDLFVGNTCVLMDRDPLQAKRREVYGRAGEYRLPAHGLEYRVPSNFWLRHYTLMSLVMNLARTVATLAINVPGDYNVRGREEILKWLDENINKEDVREAINKNDYDLALKNHEVVEEFTKEFIPGNTYKGYTRAHNVPLWPEMLPWFRHFVSVPMKKWFPDEPIEYWPKHNYQREFGWESFVTHQLNQNWNKKTK